MKKPIPATRQTDLECLFGIVSEAMKTNLRPCELMVLSAVSLHDGITKYGVRVKLGFEYSYHTADTLISRQLIEIVDADPGYIPKKGRKQLVGMRITQDGFDLIRAILKEGARRGRGQA